MGTTLEQSQRMALVVAVFLHVVCVVFLHHMDANIYKGNISTFYGYSACG